MRFTGFIGPSYTLQSVNVDCQRCINLYPELNELGTGKEREVAALRGTPGLRLLATLGNGPIRGIYRTTTGVLFVVSEGTIYSVDSSWTATSVGTLSTSAGPVSMADNGIQLMLVDGTYGYFVTLASAAFAQITDPDFPGADQVTFQDGFFIFNVPDSQGFMITALNDVTVDATDIAYAEGLADDLVGVLSDQRNLYLLGTISTEVFYDSGNADTPFVRVQGAFIPVGCAAAFSAVKLQGSIYWLAQDEHGRGYVVGVQNYQHARISNHALEKILAGISADDLSNATAWGYQQAGHTFYCLNIPGAESTWVYDLSTKLWHERAFLNEGVLERHRGNCHAFVYGTNVVGDYENGNIYALDPDTYTDNSDEILRERTAPHISKQGVRLIYHQFRVDLESGVGLTSGQGSDPKAMLQWSDDGGHTWSNEKWAGIGALGRYGVRAIWRRLGASRDRVYRFRITDPVKVCLVGAEFEAEEAAS